MACAPRYAPVASIGEVDGATLRSLHVHVPPQTPRGVDRVIGTNILVHFFATIDYPHRRLLLRARTASHTFEATAEARGAIVVPMVILRGQEIFVRARQPGARNIFYRDAGGPGIGVDLTKTEVAAAAIRPDVSHPQIVIGGAAPTKVPTYWRAYTSAALFSRECLECIVPIAVRQRSIL